MEREHRFNYLAELFEYPVTEQNINLGQALSLMDGISNEAATHLKLFLAKLSELSLSQQQEMFVQTFDMNPGCALEIGWHLFGEDYKRGELLAYLRSKMRSLRIQEGIELPDHLGNVLRLLGRWETEEAAEFVEIFLNPALQKIKKAVSVLNTPYTHLFDAIDAVCSVEFRVAPIQFCHQPPSNSTQLQSNLHYPQLTLYSQLPKV